MVQEVCLRMTRISGYQKESLRNLNDRQDETRYSYHFLECSLKDLYEFGMETAKKHFGDKFKMNYTQFMMLRPFNNKRPTKEQWMCIYCLGMANIYRALASYVVAKGTQPCPPNCLYL